MNGYSLSYIAFLDRFRDPILTSVFISAINQKYTYSQAKSTLVNTYATASNQNPTTVSTKVNSIIEAFKFMKAWAS